MRWGRRSYIAIDIDTDILQIHIYYMLQKLDIYVNIYRDRRILSANLNEENCTRMELYNEYIPGPPLCKHVFLSTQINAGRLYCSVLCDVSVWL